MRKIGGIIVGIGAISMGPCFGITLIYPIEWTIGIPMLIACTGWGLMILAYFIENP